MTKDDLKNLRFKENDVVMFFRTTPFDIWSISEKKLSCIFLMGIVSAVRENESKVQVIFADGNSGLSEWFDNKELINIKEIGNIYLPTGDKLFEDYQKRGEYFTKKQRNYIAYQYNLWLEKNRKDIITYTGW